MWPAQMARARAMSRRVGMRGIRRPTPLGHRLHCQPFSRLAFRLGPSHPYVFSSNIAGNTSRALSLEVTCKVPTRREQLAKRHKRVRNTVEGTPERPRLAVFRSNNHMYAQVIDDVSQSTLVMTSTLSKDIKSGLNGVTNNTEAAAAVGKAVAELCKEKKIEKVCFDRGGFQYHGRVKALADAAREGGLSF